MCPTLTEVVALSERSLIRALADLGSEGLPFYSQSGVKIADDLDDFLDGGWDACLQTSPGPDCAVAAGVLPDGAYWWHGANFSDSFQASDNCNDFSAGTSGFFVGNVGIASSDGEGGHPSQWDGLVAECDGSNLPAPAHLVCACGQR